MMKKLLLLLLVPFVFTGCVFSDDDRNVEYYEEHPYADFPTLQEIVNEREDMYTFSRALKALDAENFLSSDVQFTLFVPTDEAFNQVPTEVREELFLPENKKKLDTLIGYHVAKGRGTSDEFFDGAVVQTLLKDNGILINVEEDGSFLINNGARVVEADIQASNGVIFFIDSVLVPQGFGTKEPANEAAAEMQEPEFDVYWEDIFGNNEDFEEFQDALKDAEIWDIMKDRGDVTLFIPSEDVLEELDRDIKKNPQKLERVLKGHMVDAVLKIEELVEGMELTTMDGTTLTITHDEDGLPMVNGAYFEMVDEGDDAHVLHVIDDVFVPEDIDLVLPEGLDPSMLTPEMKQQMMEATSGEVPQEDVEIIEEEEKMTNEEPAVEESEVEKDVETTEDVREEDVQNEEAIDETDTEETTEKTDEEQTKEAPSGKTSEE